MNDCIAPVIHITLDDSQCQTFGFVPTVCVLIVLLSEHKPDSFGLFVSVSMYSVVYGDHATEQLELHFATHSLHMYNVWQMRFSNAICVQFLVHILFSQWKFKN